MFKVANAALQILRFLGVSIFRGTPSIQHECQEFLDILNIQVQIKGHLPAGPCLLVANHRSFLDVLALGQMDQMVFVTSQEVASSRFTGLFSRLAGCILVERRNYSTLLQDIEVIKQHMLAGQKVCVFPEATTTNGVEMARWRSSLFEAAVKTNTPVVPIAIDYTSVNGQTVTEKNRDILYYIDDMTFYDHIKNIFKIKDAHINIKILKPISGLNRKILACVAERAVKDALHT